MNTREAAQFPPVRLRDRDLIFGGHTYVMGITNLTDDSFSGNGLHGDAAAALEEARRFVADGGEILDLGAESTRPGSDPVPVEQETERIVAAVKAIRGDKDPRVATVPISIDTMKAPVAQAALEAGADLINDVYGLRGEGMIEVCAEFGCPVIVMHMKGMPRDMQVSPEYEDVVAEVKQFLAVRIEACVAGGIAREQIIVDPGFGFGKTVAHNLEVLRRLAEFRSLQRPILLGTSRKSTLGKVLARKEVGPQGETVTVDLPPGERIFGTAATCALGIAQGADILRVHDVAQMVQVARMTDAVVRGWPEA